MSANLAKQVPTQVMPRPSANGRANAAAPPGTNKYRDGKGKVFQAIPAGLQRAVSPATVVSPQVRKIETWGARIDGKIKLDAQNKPIKETRGFTGFRPYVVTNPGRPGEKSQPQGFRNAWNGYLSRLQTEGTRTADTSMARFESMYKRIEAMRTNP
ncbi:MAG: hypothetical protein DHS20C21_24160 [Gemmatimonadota bacterium]|nr:MAG: hypothetical protein DHS20C21_24160 [Gemmatimonadota bacterium]